jgi:zinc transporter 1
VHELHVWQLSEAKVVASVHITASRKVDFMTVAAQVRERLHYHGIHSCTIQPEYHQERNAPPDDALKVRGSASRSLLISLVCADDCGHVVSHFVPSGPGLQLRECLLP